MKGDAQKQPTLLGWREYVALPDWGIRRIRAKIDTGARLSAIHVANLEELENNRIRFEVVTREKPVRKAVWIETTPHRETIIKPSSGIRQTRTVVRTRIIIGDVEKEIELSLVSRKGMLCRMLLGRTAMENAFLVDPSRKYLVSDTAGANRAKRNAQP